MDDASIKRKDLPWESSLADRRGGGRDNNVDRSNSSLVTDPHLADTRELLKKDKLVIYSRMYIEAHDVVASLDDSATLSYAQCGEPELYLPEMLATR
jgi:hypothetical protein